MAGRPKRATDTEKILWDRVKGKSLRKIAKQFRASPATVLQRLRELEAKYGKKDGRQG